MQDVKAQKPITLSIPMIYDFNFFNTSKNVDNYYPIGFNKLRKEDVVARPSGAYGLELSYGLNKKWMGEGGLIIAHYNYQTTITNLGGFDNTYGYRLFSIPLSFKYYPLHHEEYFYIKAGLQIDNIVDVYGIDVNATPGTFPLQIEFIDQFQPGYFISMAIENHSSKEFLLGFGVHFKSKFTEISDQFEFINQAGEVLSAFGLECKIGYRFHNSREVVHSN